MRPSGSAACRPILTVADLRIPARTPRVNARSAGLLPSRAGIALRDSLVSLSESSLVGGCSVVFRVQASVMPDLRRIPAWQPADVVVETPRGARAKLEFDPELATFVLSNDKVARSGATEIAVSGDAGPFFGRSGSIQKARTPRGWRLNAAVHKLHLIYCAAQHI